MKKFPKEIFVHRENQGTKDEFLEVTKTTDELAVVGTSISVGRYVLKETLNVTARTEVKVAKEK